MKAKIFLIWLVALFTVPLYMNIPVVGHWLLYIFVVGPVAIAFGYFMFNGKGHSSEYWRGHYDGRHSRF